MITISPPKQPKSSDEDSNHNSNHNSQKPAPEPFPLTHCDEIMDASEPLDFVERLITEGGASVVYGASNTGKSFWILDLCACVATGRPFRDELEVEQGAVVYVALEGTYGIRNRILAMRKSGKLPKGSPLFLCFVPLNLLEAGQAGRLAETIKSAAAKSDLPCRLVVIDTMARAMAGGDENSGRDMTSAMQAVAAVQKATGAHVGIIHHCGKDEAKGARGHSSLKAAVDTEIEVFRPEGETISTVRITKQRELPKGDPMPFSLKVVELGIDRRGNRITSCTVHHEDEMMAASPGKAGRKKTYHAEQLLSHLPAVRVKDWMERAREETGMSAALFYQFKAELEKSEAVRKTSAGIVKA